MPIAPPDSTLQAIMTKVRRITRSPSPAQLADADLENYINTFMLYDFPEHLRTFNFKIPFSFWTNPFQDVYPTDIISFGGAANASKQPLYNFENKYLTVHKPVYIAGFQSFYTQSREQFFGIYPITNSIASIGFVGDGVTTNFTGVIPIFQGNNVASINTVRTALLQNNVLFSSVDVNVNGLSMIDSPILDSSTGNPTVFGILFPSNNQPVLPLLCTPPYNNVIVNPQFAPYVNNFINYSTGQFSVTFPTAPGSGAPINSQTVPQIISLPQALLFHDNHFTVRPVPDQPYQVNFEVFVRPTQFLSTTQTPQLEEYWQYVAYGSAKKVFEDRMDLDSVQMIMPEFKQQERLVLRRSLVQLANERVATIYTEQTNLDNGGNSWGFGGSLF